MLESRSAHWKGRHSGLLAGQIFQCFKYNEKNKSKLKGNPRAVHFKLQSYEPSNADYQSMLVEISAKAPFIWGIEYMYTYMIVV